MSLLKVFLLWMIILSLGYEEYNLLTALREFSDASLEFMAHLPKDVDKPSSIGGRDLVHRIC